MGAHIMKTTLEISDPVLREAKKLAAERGTTLRHVVESALRHAVEEHRRVRRRFRMRKRSFRGRGLQAGVNLGDWGAIRERIYEGRGG